MNNCQTARLVLKSSDIQSGTDGTFNTNYSQYTFNNINLRTVLGDMYDKYDTFNLCLNSIYSNPCSPALGSDGSGNDLTLYIELSGLPFINQTYDIYNKCNNDSTTIASVNFVRNSPLTQLYYNSSCNTFSKNQELVNLTFNYYRIKDDLIPSSNANYPFMIYIFDIIGIPRDEGNKNGKRLVL